MSTAQQRMLETHFETVIRNVKIDRLTGELVGAFAKERIQTLVLKGPSFAEWLYPGEIRVYRDSDLLVAPEDWPRAVEVLRAMGFHSWVLSPLSVDPGGTDFERGQDEIVDLHAAIPGLFGDPRTIWVSLLERSELRVLAGRAQIRVLDRDAQVLHVAVHAGHHANHEDCKPFDDLRRALDLVTEPQWRRALQLARAYNGLEAFATGLRCLPEGRDLARRLQLEEVSSFRFELRLQDNAIAEELSALLSSEVGFAQKLKVLIRELFPKPAYMRSWLSLCRYGPLGLAIGYLWRPLWAAGQVPGAVLALRRVHRSQQDRRSGAQS